MSSSLKKLEGDPSTWKLDEFFEKLEKELDELRKDDPGEEDYFRKYPWKWTVSDAKHPKVANDDLGIPGSIEELEELVEQKSFRKAEDHTKEEYFQYLTNADSRAYLEARMTHYFVNADKIRSAFAAGRALVGENAPKEFAGQFWKGKIESYEVFKTQLYAHAQKAQSSDAAGKNTQKQNLTRLGKLRQFLREMIFNKEQMPFEKARAFREILDEFFIDEKEGFEFPDIEGDDLYFRGHEEFTPILGTLGLIMTTFGLSENEFRKLEADITLQVQSPLDSKTLNQNKSIFYEKSEEFIKKKNAMIAEKEGSEKKPENLKQKNDTSKKQKDKKVDKKQAKNDKIDTGNKKQNKVKDDKAKDKNANEKEAYAKLAATTGEPENVPSQPPPSYEKAIQDEKKPNNQKKNSKKTPLLKYPPPDPQVCPPSQLDVNEYNQMQHHGQFQQGPENFGHQNNYGRGNYGSPGQPPFHHGPPHHGPPHHGPPHHGPPHHGPPHPHHGHHRGGFHHRGGPPHRGGPGHHRGGPHRGGPHRGGPNRGGQGRQRCKSKTREENLSVHTAQEK